MDVLCASLACKRITETQLESLKEACEKFEEAVKAPEKDLTHIAACDVALHDIIIDATANRRLKQLVNNLSEQMYRYRFEYLKDSEIYDQLVKEHSDIYAAIAARDEEAAANACGIHIDNQEYAIMKQIALNKE